MGLVYSTINLSNPLLPELNSIHSKCLANSGSTYLVIPQHIANQLQLKVLESREATLADGSSHTVPYAGPVMVNFENRNCFVGALIMGDEVLLGAVPMEDMDLVIIPKLLKLVINPESPNIARGHAKISVFAVKRDEQFLTPECGIPFVMYSPFPCRTNLLSTTITQGC